MGKVLLFLNQMLGVVQLDRYTIARLEEFIFGGEDNDISPGEEAVMKAWTARLFETIWADHVPLRAFALSISFNDADFQRLMLNERRIPLPALSPRDQGPPR